MDDRPWLQLAISLGLILGNAFFVASEYALVGCRKSRIDALAKRGNRSARLVQDALENLSPYVAGIQIAITMFSIGVGSVAEPFVTAQLSLLIGGSFDRGISFTLSFILVTYLMVVIGELVPKYITLERAEVVALAVIRPMRLLVKLLKPLIWGIERSGRGVAWALGVRKLSEGENDISREELVLMLKAGSSKGMVDRIHAEMVSKAMHLDKLDAQDIMIHRLDIKWLDVELTRDETLEQFRKIKHTRIPVCRGDIDDVVGVVYVNDLVNHLDDPKFNLATLARPAVVVPENLTLDRVISRMREDKTQILIVVDEYGGTAGLITLEDVVEEIFGELEDSLESERPPIEVQPSGRVSAKADVRFDEVVSFLNLDLHDEPTTDTLANLMVQDLGRLPKFGDLVQTPLGTLRVENMARRRITRVALQLSKEIMAMRSQP